MSFAALRHLYRDRRRIIASLVLLVGIVILGRDTLPDPFPVATEILGIFPILVAIPLYTLKFRRHRHLVEVAFLGTFLHLALARLLPGSIWDYTGPWGMTPVGFGTWLAMMAGTRVLLYGHWSDRFATTAPVRVAARSRSRLPVSALWYGLVPTPGHLDKNPDPEVVSIDYADPSRRVIRLVTWLPPRKPGETLIHIDAIEPLRSVTLRLRVISGVAELETEGTTSFTITDHGRYRDVHVAHEMDGLTPRRIIGGFLDDRLGRMMDARLNAVERGVDRRAGRQARALYEDFLEEGREVGTGQAAPTAAGYRTAYGRQLSERERALAGAGER